MSSPKTLPDATAHQQSPQTPVRVRHQRVNANLAQPQPPDGTIEEWRGRLKIALGTASDDFVDVTLLQLQQAARLPCDGISELGVNAALALIEAAKPANEIEASLIIQMACTHSAAMAVLSRLGGAHGGDRHVAILAAAGGRILNAFTRQIEALRRLRNGGFQIVRVEHIHFNEGAQAVIGSVTHSSRATHDDQK